MQLFEQLSFLLLYNICQETLQITSYNKSEACSSDIHYKYKGRCCKRCPPGEFAAQRCDSVSDTLCQLCTNGTFTQQWNYVRSCLLCLPCEQAMGLTEEDHCSPTHQTTCVCRPGLVCQNWDIKGKCRYCSNQSSPGLLTTSWSVNIPTRATDITSMSKVTTATSQNISTGVSVWIIPLATVLIVAGIITLLFIWSKISCWSKIGGLLGSKEFRGPPACVQVTPGHSVPLLVPSVITPRVAPATEEGTAEASKATAANMSLKLNRISIGNIALGTNQRLQFSASVQEEGGELRFPIQETQPPQCKDFTQCDPPTVQC